MGSKLASNASVYTLADFNWGALRPNYAADLIKEAVN